MQEQSHDEEYQKYCGPGRNLVKVCCKTEENEIFEVLLYLHNDKMTTK